jgi:hypothetical protein
VLMVDVLAWQQFLATSWFQNQMQRDPHLVPSHQILHAREKNSRTQPIRDDPVDSGVDPNWPKEVPNNNKIDMNDFGTREKEHEENIPV